MNKNFKITIVAGARPNFMKIAPIIHEINKINANREILSYRLVHTGQHYDQNMSYSFFEQLKIPEPNINLNCSGASQAEMTANIMLKFENELIKNKSDLVLVVGDVNSTMACAIVAQKLKIKVAHVEAGIRSNDWSMPEEINRLVTDRITNYFFTTSQNANKNLINEGVDKKNIFFVGNTMIDTLKNNLKNLKKPDFWDNFSLKKKNYFVLTLHRPSNVDNGKKLYNTISKIVDYSKNLPIVFPMHPRTKKIFKSLKISNPNLHIVSPLSYFEFNYIVKNSFAVITDSGGITEETTFLGIPCITLRNTTERPETINYGTNELIGENPNALPSVLEKLFSGNWKKGSIPDLWDGNSAQRIIKKILDLNKLK